MNLSLVKTIGVSITLESGIDGCQILL